MSRLEELAKAIMYHEGFHPGSRSWRNNNPGNLRSAKLSDGTTDGFATFKTFAIGYMALQWDLLNKCLGNTVTKLGPTSTIADLITVWAPPEDNNDTQAYIQAVCNAAGVQSDTPLSYFTQANV